MMTGLMVFNIKMIFSYFFFQRKKLKTMKIKFIE